VARQLADDSFLTIREEEKREGEEQMAEYESAGAKYVQVEKMRMTAEG
jgi:hypothetical protein